MLSCPDPGRYRCDHIRLWRRRLCPPRVCGRRGGGRPVPAGAADLSDDRALQQRLFGQVPEERLVRHRQGGSRAVHRFGHRRPDCIPDQAERRILARHPAGRRAGRDGRAGVGPAADAQLRLLALRRQCRERTRHRGRWTAGQSAPCHQGVCPSPGSEARSQRPALARSRRAGAAQYRPCRHQLSARAAVGL